MAPKIQKRRERSWATSAPQMAATVSAGIASWPRLGILRVWGDFGLGDKSMGEQERDRDKRENKKTEKADDF